MLIEKNPWDALPDELFQLIFLFIGKENPRTLLLMSHVSKKFYALISLKNNNNISLWEAVARERNILPRETSINSTCQMLKSLLFPPPPISQINSDSTPLISSHTREVRKISDASTAGFPSQLGSIPLIIMPEPTSSASIIINMQRADDDANCLLKCTLL